MLRCAAVLRCSDVGQCSVRRTAWIGRQPGNMPVTDQLDVWKIPSSSPISPKETAHPERSNGNDRSAPLPGGSQRSCPLPSTPPLHPRPPLPLRSPPRAPAAAAARCCQTRLPRARSLQSAPWRRRAASAARPGPPAPAGGPRRGGRGGLGRRVCGEHMRWRRGGGRERRTRREVPRLTGARVRQQPSRQQPSQGRPRGRA